MYDQTPGRVRIAAAREVNHGEPAVVGTVIGTYLAGIAHKITPRASTAGLTGQEVIDASEVMMLKWGFVCEVAESSISTPAVGDLVYIDPDDDTLTKTSTNNLPFGRIVAIPASDASVPTGKVRIDMTLRV